MSKLPDGWVWSDTLPEEKDYGWQAAGPHDHRAWTVGEMPHPMLEGNSFVTYDGEEIHSTPISVVLAVLDRAGLLPGNPSKNEGSE